MSRALVITIALIATCFLAVGQTATGVLQGRVFDSTGAAVPEAKVSIQNEDTGTGSVLSTNSDGNFTQSFLLPGNYQVTVEKAGFQKYLTPHVRAGVEQKVGLDIALKVGDITTTVEVTATGTQLATGSSSVSTVISTRSIMDLPLNGRNPMNLVGLTPGVQSQNGASTPWISGGRNGTSEITIDGTSIILPENNVGINTTAYTPIVDSVEEFTVITNALAAEYGRTGGGTINMATRGGTNTLHGSAYDYLKNSALGRQLMEQQPQRGPEKPVPEQLVRGDDWRPGLVAQGLRWPEQDLLFLQRTEQPATHHFSLHRHHADRRLEERGLLPTQEWQRPAGRDLRPPHGCG